MSMKNPINLVKN